jgi:hypothetical protein
MTDENYKKHKTIKIVSLCLIIKAYGEEEYQTVMPQQLKEKQQIQVQKNWHIE